MSPVDHLRALAEAFAEPDDDPALSALGEALGGLLEALAYQLGGGGLEDGYESLLDMCYRLGEVAGQVGAKEPS